MLWIGVAIFLLYPSKITPLPELAQPATYSQKLEEAGI